ncbi:MAG: hypothetical protein ABII23_09610 [bacterium]
MAVNRWQLVKEDSNEFHDRYLLKLDSSREAALKLYKTFEQNSCIPFAVQNDDFGWEMHLDGMDEKKIEMLKSYLSDITHPEIKKIKEEKISAHMEKIEIIDSTWDWQRMQMERGIESNQENSNLDKPKTSSRIVDLSVQSKPEKESASPPPSPVPSIEDDIRLNEMKLELLQRENREHKRKDEAADDSADQQMSEDLASDMASHEYFNEKIKEEKPEEIIKIERITSEVKPENPLIIDKQPLQMHPGEDEPLFEKFKTKSVIYDSANAEDGKPEEETKDNVEVEEIVSELNKILADFTDDLKPEAPEEQLQGMEQKGDIPDKGEELKSIDDEKALTELSKMIDDSGAQKSEETKPVFKDKPSEPMEPEPVVNAEPLAEPVLEPAQLNPEPVPMPVSEPEPDPGPPTEPSKIRIVVLLPSDDEAVGEAFVKHISNTIAKVSKDKLSIDLLGKNAIDADAFDPQAVFKQIEEIYPDIVCFVGLEKASEFKLSQLISLLGKKKISYKKMEKNKINKQFVYLDLAVAMMLEKRKILGRKSSF